jgi:hypothetical protein
MVLPMICPVFFASDPHMILKEDAGEAAFFRS